MQAIHTETFEGFEIAFYALPEDTAPEDSFDLQPGDDTLERIADGRLEWFCAKVTASRAGVELACDFLGGCCYESAADFVTGSGYWEDMRAAAVNEARAKLAELCHA